MKITTQIRRGLAHAIAFAWAATPATLRVLLELAALAGIGYGMEGIRPRLGYLAVGVLLWWELRKAGRPTGGRES